jgi:hypothetical protein
MVKKTASAYAFIIKKISSCNGVKKNGKKTATNEFFV